MAYFGGIFFANVGGGGGQHYFQKGVHRVAKGGRQKGIGKWGFLGPWLKN